MGDKEKDIVVLSEFQQSYKPHDVSGRAYDPQGAQRIRETTIKEKDDRLNRYVTEMVDQFVPKSGARTYHVIMTCSTQMCVNVLVEVHGYCFRKVFDDGAKQELGSSRR